MTRRLGCIPDRPRDPGEPQDCRYVGALRDAPPPPSVDLRHLVVEVLDQSSLGSCYSNAAAQAIRMRHVAQGIAHPPLASRLFLYYLARSFARPSTVAWDSGASIRDGIDAINEYGFPPEDAWPYSPADTGAATDPFRRMPPADAFRRALDQRSPIVYQRIVETDTDAVLAKIKTANAEGFPVIFGGPVGDDFVHGDIDGTKPLMPPTKSAGLHAMLFVGYEGDDLLVCNSWGSTDWGDGGYCRFAPAYLSAGFDFAIIEHVPVLPGASS